MIFFNNFLLLPRFPTQFPPRAEAAWVVSCSPFFVSLLPHLPLPLLDKFKRRLWVSALHSLSPLYHSLPNFTTARTKIAHFSKVCTPLPHSCLDTRCTRRAGGQGGKILASVGMQTVRGWFRVVVNWLRMLFYLGILFFLFF